MSRSSSKSTAITASRRRSAVPGGASGYFAPIVTDKLLGPHYFVPYPRSYRGTFSVASVANDTGQSYDSNYLAPTGDNSGSWGPFLRDRPPVGVVRSSLLNSQVGQAVTWVDDMKDELAAMVAAGYNSVFVDYLSYGSASFGSRSWTITRALLQAAVGSGIQVWSMPDMTAGGATVSVQSVVDDILDFMSYPGAGRLPGGEHLIVPFTPETRTQAFWDSVDTALTAAGASYKWCWCVQDYNAQVATYAARPKTWGMSNWGSRNPAQAVNERGRGTDTHGRGLKWIQPLALMDQRPPSAIYDEGNGSQTMREFWQSFRTTNADGAQFITWNDYSESTIWSPSRNNADSVSWASRWYLRWAVSGVKPVPTNDFLCLIHRLHHTSATLPAGKTRMSLRGGSTATQNTVECMAWCSAPGSVAVTVGGVTTTFSVVAGENILNVPLTTFDSGAPAASLTRNGSTVLTVTSRNTITTTPPWEDLAYYWTHAVTAEPVGA